MQSQTGYVYCGYVAFFPLGVRGHIHYPVAMKTSFSLLIVCVSLLTLAACSAVPKGEAKYPSGADRTATGNDIYKKPESIFGRGGLKLFGGRESNAKGNNGIDVNSYLWRAALDTVSFMPLASADPFGGVIITDWYAAEETPNERVKLNVFILNRELTANGVSVKVFRQVKSAENWKDVKVDPATSRQLEDSILTRARQLRIAERKDE